MRENYACFLETFLAPKNVTAFLNGTDKSHVKVDQKGQLKIKKVKDHPLSRKRNSEWNQLF